MKTKLFLQQTIIINSYIITEKMFNKMVKTILMEVGNKRKNVHLKLVRKNPNESTKWSLWYHQQEKQCTEQLPIVQRKIIKIYSFAKFFRLEIILIAKRSFFYGNKTNNHENFRVYIYMFIEPRISTNYLGAVTLHNLDVEYLYRLYFAFW